MANPFEPTSGTRPTADERLHTVFGEDEHGPPGEKPADAVEQRVPPHDLDAEAAVLSAVMNDRPAYDLVADLLEVDHFYSEAHRRIWEAAQGCDRAGKPIDIVTIATWLRERDRLSQVGGMAYLTTVLNAAPALAHTRAYGETVWHLARTRGLVLLYGELQALAYARRVPPEDFVDYSEQRVAEVVGGVSQGSGRMLGESVGAVYNGIATAYQTGKPRGMPTGLREWDDLTIGLHPGELTVVAARPGQGKTALMLGLAEYLAATVPPMFAIDDGQPVQPCGVYVWSGEMPEEEVVMRLLASRASVSLTRLRSAQLSGEEWQRLAEAANHLAQLHIWIDDTPALPVSVLRARVRRIKRLWKGKGVRMIAFVGDYLGLMKGSRDGARMTREQEIGSITRSLADMAKQEKIACVVGSQLNRDLEKRSGKDKRPVLADLRESGSVEQDAQNVVFIYRPESYGEQVAAGEEGLAELIIAKQRNGPPGIAKCRYRGIYTRFENLTG